MNLPDWLSLSATSGTGSGKITATVDKCTARAARRTTEFSVKTDSGSSRRVRVIQNGIAEFVNITTQDISLQATSSGSIQITGTSNSAILSLLISGSLPLTLVAQNIVDVDGNNISFISGSPINGDPGAAAQYSFSFVLTYTENAVTEIVESVVSVVAQSGVSASIKVTQQAGESADSIYPSFTYNSMRVVGPSGEDIITPAIVVYDPSGLGWDILCSSTTGITIERGETAVQMTPINVTLTPNLSVENYRDFTLFLVPSGAGTTAVTYSTLTIRQLEALTNPFIDGDLLRRSYAGGLVVLNVVDQKNVGWYPQTVFGPNVGTVLISGTADNTQEPYVDALDSIVFAQATGNTKMVGDGTIKIHINNASSTGETVMEYLRKSISALEDEAYDSAQIDIVNVPQFNVPSHEIILAGNEGNKVDTSVFIANPEGVSFVVYTSGNAGNRQAVVTANGVAVPDASDSGAMQTIYDGTQVDLSIDASNMGEFQIILKSSTEDVIFSELTVGVYRIPVIRFTLDNDEGEEYLTGHVTETVRNQAQVYSHYSAESGYREGYFDEADRLFDVQVVYGLYNLNDTVYVNLDVNTGNVTCIQCDYGETNQYRDVIVTASAAGSGYYKDALSQYTLRVTKTKAYVVLTGLESITLDGASYMKKTLYLPDIESEDYPSWFIPTFSVEVDDYRSGTPVKNQYEAVFGSPCNVIYTLPAENFLIQEGTAIRAIDFPPPNSTAFGQVSICPDGQDVYTHFMGEDTYNNNVFLVFVEQNENFLLQLSAGWIENVPDPGEYPYLFYTTGGTNSKPVSVTLYSTLGENQNLKPVNNVLAIRVDGTLYRLENASRELVTIGGIAPAGFTAVRQSASESINVLTNQTRNIDFAMLSYSEGYIKTVEVIAYADLEYTKPLANAFFVMQQLPAEANGYEFVLDEGDAEWQASVGNFESASMTGIYAPAGIHSFNVALINRSTQTGVGGATISVTKEFYTTPYVANKSFFETITSATSEGLWESTENSWLRVLVGGGEVGGSTYTTGSNGYPAGSPTPEMEIEWLQNSTNETIKRCVVTLAVTGVEGDCSVVYEFYQRSNVSEYAVVFYDGENYYENGSVRSVDADYSELSAGYVAILCDKSVGYSEISGATYEYGVSDATKGVSINETTGVITLSQNIEAGTEVDITASGSLNGNEVAYSRYRLSVKAAAQTAHITHNIPATATYLDSDILVEAYSDSGAVVTFSTQSSKVTLGQTEIIQAERNGVTVSVTRQWIGIAGASTSNAGETITLSCPATETYKETSENAAIKINKYNDYVVSWDGPYVNGVKKTALQVNSINTFYVTTGTGNSVKSYSYDLSRTSFNYATELEFNKTNSGFTIKPKTTGDVGLIAYLNYNDNFGSGQNNTLQISTQAGTTREVYFTNEPYQITVNGSPTQLTWAFNPASANSGTPTFSYDNTKLSITKTNNQWYVVGLAKGSFDLTIEYPQSGLYSRCYDTTTISVGLIPTTTLVWQNTPGSSTAIPLNDTSQVALATDTNAPNRTVKYTSSDESIVKISMYGGAITPKAQGTAIIYAEVQETSTYSYKKIQYDIAIGNVPVTPSCTVTFSNPSATYQVEVGSTFTKAISSKTPNDSNTYIEYSSSDNTKATVNSSGQVTGIAAGTVTITATATRSGYNPGTASYQITVTPVSVTVPVITVTNPSVTIYLPNDQQLPTTANLGASVNNDVQTVKYTSLSPSAVSVSNDGTVTGITTGSNLVIRIYVEATGSYAAKETTAKVTVLQANTPTQDTPDVVDFTQTTTMQTVDVLLGNKYYNKAEATVSHRPVYYSVSNSTIASILYARVQVNGAVENNVITLTTSGNKTVTFKITASSSSTSKNGQTLEWSTDSTTSFTVKTGDVFYVHAALLESGGSKASYYSNSTSVMWSSVSSNVVIDGGVLVGKTASANPVEVKAQVYAGQSGGVNYTAAYDTYYATISYQMPSLRFTYLPSDIQEGARQFSFSRTSTLPVNFNLPIYDNVHAGYFEWCYNAGSGNTSNTSIATVSNEGIVTLVGGVGEVSVKAAIAAHGNYGRVEASYTMIISGYYIKLNNSRFNIGGRGGTVTVRATYMKVMNGAADEEYNDTPTVEGGCQSIVPNNGTSQTTAVLSTYHDITYSFGINRGSSENTIPLTINSNIGSASVTFSVVQGTGDGSTNPSWSQYVITQSNSTTNSTVYNHDWDFGEDSGTVVEGTAGCDEDYAEGVRLSHESGNPLWLEIQSYNNRMSDSSLSISYEVLISDDGSTWTATSSGSWFKFYIGDGHSDQSQYSQYFYYGTGSNLHFDSNGKMFPHIKWDANNTGHFRYGKVLLYYGSSTQKYGLYTITFTQRNA